MDILKIELSFSPSEYLHTNNMSAAYAAVQVDEANWQRKIFHKEAATSLGHCLALCRVATFSGSATSYNCNMLHFDGTACYIGDNEKDECPPCQAVPAGMSTVHLDRGNAS